MTDNKERVLIIDDEIAPRESLRMVLKDRYNVSTATGAREGFNIMTQNPADLVVLDIMMPEINGIEAMKEIKQRHPDTEVILLTAFASIESARSAIRYGAFDYLTKPFDKDDVITVVERGLEKRRANINLKVEKDKLWSRTRYLEEQINSARQNLVMSYEGTVKALILTIDAKDHYTFNHSEHVARLSVEIAKVLNLPGKVKDRLEQAALMHDIGKIGVDEIILRKNGRLTDDEFTEIKKHPVIGATIVQQVPFLEDAIPVILHHHETYHGRGYPIGLKGEEIPLTARIVMVADAIDAMMRARPYRGALPMEKVFSELRENAGTQFDPQIVELILKGRISLE
ncbi:MAG: response regulator [Nitrospirae bacterium]|nr:response regulator [Nitrospirota bacterium]